MKNNGETKTFNCGHQQSEEGRRKLGEYCNKIAILKYNNSKSKEVFYVNSASSKSKSKERNKRKKVELHDGRWINTKRNRSGKVSLELSDESINKS